MNVFDLDADWDAAFGGGLVSFGDGGNLLVKPRSSYAARAALKSEDPPPLSLTADPRRPLERHRAHHGF